MPNARRRTDGPTTGGGGKESPLPEAAVATGRVTRAATAILAAAAVEGVVGFLFVPVVVRILGPAGYGQYATLLAIFGFSQVLTNLGLFSAIRKSLAESSPERAAEVASGGILLSALLGCAATGLGLGLLLVPGLPSSITALRLPVALMALSLLVWNVYQAGRSILFGQYREQEAEPLRMLAAVLTAGVGVVTLLLGWGVTGLLLAIFIGNGAAAAGALVLAVRQVRVSWTAATTGLQHGKDWMGFGIYTALGILFAQFLYYANLLIVSTMLGVYEAGVYRAALLFAEMLWIVPGALQVSLLHNVSGLWVRGKREEIGGMLDRALQTTLLLSIVGTTATVVLAGPLVVLYFGSAFADAVLPVQILTLGAFGFAVARILNPLVEGAGLIKTNVAASGVLAFSNIGASLLVIPIAGLLGAAIISATTYGLKLVQLGWLARRTKVPYGATLPLGRIGVFALCCVAAAVAGSWAGARLGTAPELVLTVGGGALLAAAAIAATRLGLVSGGSVVGLVRSVLAGRVGQGPQD